MAKKVVEEKEVEVVVETAQKIAPLEFADVSVLKDKLNEVIAFLNK